MLLYSGNKQFAAKNYKKAVAIYGNALAANPSDEEAGVILANRSAAYTHLQKYDLATADAEQAAERRPRWPKAQVRLAEALSRKHAHEHALKAWQLAIEYSDNEDDKQRYRGLMEQARQAAATVSAKNAPARPNYNIMQSLDDAWYTKLERAIKSGQLPAHEVGLGMHLAMRSWQECEKGWKAIDNAIEILPDGSAKTDLFNPFTLSSLVETILTDQSGFHIGYSEKDAKSMQEKLNHLLRAEASAERIIDDLDARIAVVGRDRIRRITASVIYNHIIIGFLAMAGSKYGYAIEAAKKAVQLLEAGLRKWAHEDPDTRGNIFSIKLIRNAKMEVMRCLVHGYQTAKTNSARKAFPLDEMEKWAKAVLDDKIPAAYWQRSNDIAWRLGYEALPQWEANAALGLIGNIRVAESLGDTKVAGVVKFADIEAAKRAAKYYDLAASLMPDDFHDKRMIMYCALYAHLRAGGLRVSAIRSRIAAIQHCDSKVSPCFGPLPEFEASTFCITQHEAVAGLPAHVTVKAIPTFRCPPGRDPRDFISEATWAGYPGDAGVADIVDIPSHMRNGMSGYR
ncbi:hypothetical protein BMF94_0785 [Rhodotorula taiwanensis]|uniref:Uncharacterized protein n=1 Tax=Rhodotorula taiwanensis TaxID=741276 RepID=A0A2S5BH23_9BASI|nr:hypothetical protein BMF94_0785 [Rhodotorula taiwanensis]